MVHILFNNLTWTGCLQHETWRLFYMVHILFNNLTWTGCLQHETWGLFYMVHILFNNLFYFLNIFFQAFM